MVDEAVLRTILGRDEAKTLGVIEPLHNSCGTHTVLLSFGTDVEVRYVRTNRASRLSAGLSRSPPAPGATAIDEMSTLRRIEKYNPTSLSCKGWSQSVDLGIEKI